MLHSRFFACSNPHVDRCSNPLPWDPLNSPERTAPGRGRRLRPASGPRPSPADSGGGVPADGQKLPAGGRARVAMRAPLRGVRGGPTSSECACRVGNLEILKSRPFLLCSGGRRQLCRCLRLCQSAIRLTFRSHCTSHRVGVYKWRCASGGIKEAPWCHKMLVHVCASLCLFRTGVWFCCFSSLKTLMQLQRGGPQVTIVQAKPSQHQSKTCTNHHADQQRRHTNQKMQSSATDRPDGACTNHLHCDRPWRM